jgi:regulator of chromosome condensation
MRLQGHFLLSAVVFGLNEYRVYAWGTFRNKNGILGFRPDVNIQNTPTLIPELKKIVSIHAGANHIAATTIDHKVMTWGCGEQGQLGRRIMPRSEKESSLIPRVMNFKPRGIPGHFSAAYCGGHHTFMVLEGKRVFSFGLNNHGQLGLGDDAEHEIPELIEDLDPEVGVECISGAEHHSVLLDKQG